MEHISIFRTGKLWEIDMARDVLKQAGIPHFIREETLSGLRTAFPAAPSPGVGITWSLMVPQQIAEDAKEILKQLPIDIDQNPGFWDFTSHKKIIKGYKIYIWIILLLFATGLGIGLLQIIHDILTLEF